MHRSSFSFTLKRSIALKLYIYNQQLWFHPLFHCRYDEDQAKHFHNGLKCLFFYYVLNDHFNSMPTRIIFICNIRALMELLCYVSIITDVQLKSTRCFNFFKVQYGATSTQFRVYWVSLDRQWKER